MLIKKHNSEHHQFIFLNEAPSPKLTEKKLDKTAKKTPEKIPEQKYENPLNLPERPKKALTGSEFTQSLEQKENNLKQKLKQEGKTQSEIAKEVNKQRELTIYKEILKGNIPNKLRKFKKVPVNTVINGHKVEGTIKVMPDYLMIGSNKDAVRVPMTPVTAQLLALKMGGILPTKKMVDEIYKNADIKVNSSKTTMSTPKDAIPPISKLVTQNAKVEREINGREGLVAGGKKDIVLPFRNKDIRHVQIYGLQNANGRPIQGYSGGAHELAYRDYSHGVRIVSNYMIIKTDNGIKKVVKVSDILQTKGLSKIISNKTLTRKLSPQTSYLKTARGKQLAHDLLNNNLGELARIDTHINQLSHSISTPKQNNIPTSSPRKTYTTTTHSTPSTHTNNTPLTQTSYIEQTQESTEIPEKNKTSKLKKIGELLEKSKNPFLKNLGNLLLNIVSALPEIKKGINPATNKNETSPQKQEQNKEAVESNAPIKDTTFIGDSITKGLTPSIKPNENNSVIAQNGKTTKWVLNQLKYPNNKEKIKNSKNAVILIGTNDIGGSNSAEKIFNNIHTIWGELKKINPNIKLKIATIPPFKGYKNYTSRFNKINEKRHKINQKIRENYSKIQGATLIDLDKQLADPNDPNALKQGLSFDHLHPKGSKLMAIYSGNLNRNKPT